MAKKLVQQGKPESGLDACVSCHGQDLKGQGVIPRLAGQHAEYLKTALHAFKSSTRKNDQDRFMRDVAARLSDQEIESLALYLSQLNDKKTRKNNRLLGYKSWRKWKFAYNDLL